MAVMNTEWSDNSDYGYNIHTNPAGDNTSSINECLQNFEKYFTSILDICSLTFKIFIMFG